MSSRFCGRLQWAHVKKEGCKGMGRRKRGYREPAWCQGTPVAQA